MATKVSYFQSAPDVGIPHNISYLSWKSILSGVIVAVFFHATFIALGMAAGGPALKGITTDNTAGFSIAAGIWIGVTALAAIFIGSYVATRSTRLAHYKIGGLSGLITAALFFVLALGQVQLGLSGAAKGVGSLLSVSGKGGADLLSTPAVQQVLEDATAGLNLKRPAPEVAQGVAVRLIQGKTESAKNFFVANTGITKAEADQKIATLQTELNQAIENAKEAAAKAMTYTGLAAFLVMILGAAAGLAGGILGARASFTRPLSIRTENTHESREYRNAV